MRARILFCIVSIVLGFGMARGSNLNDPASAGELIRSNLVTAQLEMGFDRAQAQKLLAQSLEMFNTAIKPRLKPETAKLIQTAFQRAKISVETGDEAGFARARAKLWSTVLNASYTRLEKSVLDGDALNARAWLTLREYRQATRFTPPDADATLAVDALGAKTISSNDALTAVRADLLDAYQSRLNDALNDLGNALGKNYTVQAAENAALAAGYFRILEPMYRNERGQASLKKARTAFVALENAPSRQTVKAARTALEGFRAAPLSPGERGKRANQTMRFLSLVPVEYARGVSGAAGNVNVVKDLEITEATTFRNSAASAFADLEPLLVKIDKTGVAQAKTGFAKLEAGLSAAHANQNPPTEEALRADVDALSAQLEKLIPIDWRKADAAGDLDVIKSQLKQLENAAAAREFDLAESARINAYAILESGAEARIKVFQPQLATDIEGLFWNGVQPDGLARLINRQASVADFKTTRLALETKLLEAARFVGTDASPVAAFVNALVIVFREGLEAVLILAALLGSLKAPAVRHLRRPLWMGALASFGATIVTFVVMRSILNAFAVFGERLEAVVSVIAVAVLLVIMNWFFHNVYWTDHLASFHKKKHQLLGANVGQGAGLAVLGFTAMYREGFETVLFLQSLVLQSGVTSVIGGALVALVLVTLVGVLVFVMQARLPHKKMLVATGAMICAVLFVIVGNTTHMLQVVGWFPIHPLPISFPYWFGLWIGTYPTWEGIIMQVVAVTFVLGSYFVAEGLKHREMTVKARASKIKTNSNVPTSGD
jgi:high-affinity iron transporter